MRVRQAHGLGTRETPSEDQLDLILAAHGAELHEGPMPGRLNELYLPGEVHVRCSLSPGRRRWAKAHALKHHLVDAGNQFWLAAHNPWVAAQQEHRAEVFAGWFLVGPRCRALPPWELAEETGLPERLIWRWYRMVAG